MLLSSEYLLDLDTGRTSPFVRSTSTPPDRLNSLVPNPDATRFHGIHEGCGRDGFYFLDTDCVVTFDTDGNETSRFEAGRSIFDGALQSFDGTMLAFVVYNPEYDASSLTITDLDGNVLSEGLYEDEEFIRSGVTSVRWLPDGDLVYADIESDRLYRVVNPPLARPEDDEVLFDPDGTTMRGGELARGLGAFDVNPVSGELVFVWNAGPDSRSRDETLYRIGADGGEPRPFARASTITRFDSPRWSFDGEWVGAGVGGSVVSGDSRDFALTALRADVAEEHVIGDALGEREDSIDIVFIDSDCRIFVGCGYDTVQPTSNEGVSGWFR